MMTEKQAWQWIADNLDYVETIKASNVAERRFRLVLKDGTKHISLCFIILAMSNNHLISISMMETMDERIAQHRLEHPELWYHSRDDLLFMTKFPVNVGFELRKQFCLQQAAKCTE